MMRGAMAVAIEVLAVGTYEDHWTVEMRVFEGVYRKERYVARVVDVPKAPAGLSADEQQARMKDFVLDQVQRHMRRGSLPPTGMQIDGQQAWLFEPDPVNF